MNTSTAPLPTSGARGPVFDFDIYESVVGDGDYPRWFRQLHDAQGRPAIYWTEANAGHWVIQSADLFTEVLEDPATFSSATNVVPASRKMQMPLVPINLDPPLHAKYRPLINVALSPKAVSLLADRARELTRELIDGFFARGQCEFAADFARHLPIGIFMKIAGLPEGDREHLLALVDDLIRPKEVGDMHAASGLITYAVAVIAERRQNPGTDLLSQIVHAKVDGVPIDDGTLIGMIILLLNGGLDTVAAVLGFTVRTLALRPDLRRQLIESPPLIPSAVEELFRRFPVSTLVREAKRDVVLGGVTIRRGELVLMQTSAHGLDPAEFPNPVEIDFTRKTVFHGTFGRGTHRCPGSMLARLELRIFLEEWLARIPDFHLANDEPLRVQGGMVVALEALPIAWDVA